MKKLSIEQIEYMYTNLSKKFRKLVEIAMKSGIGPFALAGKSEFVRRGIGYVFVEMDCLNNKMNRIRNLMIKN